MKLLTLMVLALFLLPVTCFGESALTRAAPLFYTMQTTTGTYWPGFGLSYVLCGQVEQESGWKTKAKLETSRELGRGLAQLTITERFNAYQEAVKLPPLKGWDWQNDPYNPEKQLTYLVLTDRNNFTKVQSLFLNNQERLAAAFVSYNAGLGTVLQRRALAIRTGQDNGLWFNGLEDIRLPYEKRLLYGRDLGQMRNEYPRLIFERAAKYRSLWIKKNE